MSSPVRRAYAEEVFPAKSPSLIAHETAIARDPELLNLPPKNWLAERQGPDGARVTDVLVVGSGMSGIAASAALLFKGIRNLRIVDRSPAGREGPWVTYARMETLRSPKTLTGPCTGIPSLAFRAWYEAAHGRAAWEALYKIPNAVWMEYLTWLRGVLALPVESETAVAALEPQDGLVRVELQKHGVSEIIWARHVVLATGRDGAGGAYIPETVEPSLWPDLAAHTSADIDFKALAGKRVAVLGGGASAWDNAAVALENGAARVDMYVRRKVLPQVNKGRGSAHPGFFLGWHGLSDAERWRLLVYFEDLQPPPPHETVHRTIRHPNFQIHLGAPLRKAERAGDQVRLVLTDRLALADFLIVGTGFKVDLAACPELAAFADKIATWADRYNPPGDLLRPDLARFPYLGPGFELLERDPGSLPGLQRIHLLNYGASASLRSLSGDIPGVDYGAERLSTALARSFFVEDIDHVRRVVEDFDEPELESTPFYVPPRQTGAVR